MVVAEMTMNIGWCHCINFPQMYQIVVKEGGKMNLIKLLKQAPFCPSVLLPLLLLCHAHGTPSPMIIHSSIGCTLSTGLSIMEQE